MQSAIAGYALITGASRGIGRELAEQLAADGLTVVLAERIRTEVEASSAKAGQPLTISIGVAGYPDDAAARDELLDKADWAMYLAKGAGRNRVLAFGDERVARETWLSRRGR